MQALSLDISPGGELGIVGGADGKLAVFLAEDGSVSRRLEGHVGDVDTCRFFPSGKVALSADLALRCGDTVEQCRWLLELTPQFW
jgi:WD40 repeat protein